MSGLKDWDPSVARIYFCQKLLGCRIAERCELGSSDLLGSPNGGERSELNFVRRIVQRFRLLLRPYCRALRSFAQYGCCPVGAKARHNTVGELIIAANAINRAANVAKAPQPAGNF